MKVFCDFDGTIARTTESFIKCVNTKFSLNLTENDIKDWDLTRLTPVLDRKTVDEIFESEQFWRELRPFDGSIDILNKHNVLMCSLGTTMNLAKKIYWADNKGLKFDKALLNTLYGYRSKDKKIFNMSGCVQIDDNWEALSGTNADVKILFCNNRHNMPWNRFEPSSGVYVVDYWDEIDDILRWLDECKGNTNY